MYSMYFHVYSELRCCLLDFKVGSQALFSFSISFESVHLL